jgi:hypothetical protein
MFFTHHRSLQFAEHICCNYCEIGEGKKLGDNTDLVGCSACSASDMVGERKVVASHGDSGSDSGGSDTEATTLWTPLKAEIASKRKELAR